MKGLQKLISIILVIGIIIGSLSACGKDTSKDNNADSNSSDTSKNNSDSSDDTKDDSNTSDEVVLEKYKIAVAFTQITAEQLLQQDYLKNYIGPAFNVEFMFSEAIEDADLLMTFMENAYSSGCEGFMNFQNTSIEQANAKANELGMYIITNTANYIENSDLPFSLGSLATSVDSVADMYRDMVDKIVNDGNSHNVVIASAGAGLGNPQHYESTVAILEGLRDLYGLTYDDEIANLASSRNQIEVSTGTDMKILIYPGYPNADTFVSGMSAVLQTGEYDVLLACNQAYTQFSVAIDEVEKAYGFNIKVGAFTTVSDSARSSFTTIDSTGDTSLNSAVLKPSVVVAGGMFAVLYNGITGYSENVRNNGRGDFFNTQMWLVNSAEEYEKLEKINSSADTYELNVEEIKEMLCIYNPNANFQSIYENLDSVTAEGILNARGLN